MAVHYLTAHWRFIFFGNNLCALTSMQTGRIAVHLRSPARLLALQEGWASHAWFVPSTTLVARASALRKPYRPGKTPKILALRGILATIAPYFRSDDVVLFREMG